MASTSEPPMTTMASGFCDSEPMPCESAAGVRPSIATSVVISTGRKRFSAGLARRLLDRHAPGRGAAGSS